MPEPDFEQIAQALIHDAAMVVGALSAGTDCLPARRSIVQQLHQVWNASRDSVLEQVLKGLRSERDTDQMRAVIASVEFMKKS